MTDYSNFARAQWFDIWMPIASSPRSPKDVLFQKYKSNLLKYV